MDWESGDHVVTPTEASHNNVGSCDLCALAREGLYNEIPRIADRVANRVEARSNTSTVTLLVAGGDEKRSLKYMRE
jgi:hypothetical protein